MLLNKMFIAIKKIMILLVICSLINCTSRSAQAKSERKKSNRNSSSNVEKESTKSSNIKFLPTSTTNQIIKHNYYTTSYSEKDEQSEWVAYKITSNNYNKSIERTNDYREDPFVSTQSASLNDYQGSGYDMGHLAPAHDMSHNLIAMSESFYLSNISPQKASFNRGIWKSLEGKISYWSFFNDSIYVVTGPILDNPIETIGENKVTVPKSFYKTLLAFNKGNIKAIAFIIPNEKSDKNIFSYAVSIDSVEIVTGIDFYYEIDKIIQDSIEAKRDLKTWISIK